MKITIWIQPANEGRDMTLRLDTKLESLDTPVIQRYGFKLAAAIEAAADKGSEAKNGRNNKA